MDGIRPLDLAPTAPQLDRLRRRGLRPKGTSHHVHARRGHGVLVWEKASDCGERPACVEDVHCEAQCGEKSSSESKPTRCRLHEIAK